MTVGAATGPAGTHAPATTGDAERARAEALATALFAGRRAALGDPPVATPPSRVVSVRIRAGAGGPLAVEAAGWPLAVAAGPTPAPPSPGPTCARVPGRVARAIVDSGAPEQDLLGPGGWRLPGRG